MNSSERLCDDAAAVTDARENVAPSTSVEPRISYVIARLERAVRAQINERLSPHGLTTLQYTTLSVLGSRGQPLSNAQLARRAYMTPQAMIEVLNALEEKGLIRRDPHPNHRRVYPASLTDEGRRNPAFSFRPTEDPQTIIQKLPTMVSATRVEGEKALSVVLARAGVGQGASVPSTGNRQADSLPHAQS